jgi:uncharacterized protein YgbK (DUF1537 family)
VTHRDLERLEGIQSLDGRGRAHAAELQRRREQEKALAQIDLGPGIDSVARERAEGWVNETAQALAQLESKLGLLAGFSDGELAGAIVGQMGIKAQEIREQIRPLRAAVREMER